MILSTWRSGPSGAGCRESLNSRTGRGAHPVIASVAGTARCDVPARVPAGGTIGQACPPRALVPPPDATLGDGDGAARPFLPQPLNIQPIIHIMSRTGKIARLPKEIREELNQRLQDGEPGPGLVRWLNRLPEVNEVLADRFGGRPINEVNLTEWRQGGFLDWERHEQARALVCQMAERAQDLEFEAEGVPIADRLAALLATELALYAETALREASDPKERWERLRAALQEVSKLRREDHRAARVTIERERWQAEVNRQQEEQSEKERNAAKAGMLTPLYAKVEADALAKVLGGDAEAKVVAGYVMEQQHDLTPGTLTKGQMPAYAAEAKGPAPTKKRKKAKAKVKVKKSAASAARRRQRNRRRPAPSTTQNPVQEDAEPASQPESDSNPADPLEAADATAPSGGQAQAPDNAPEAQEPAGEGPEIHEN